ncbi:hypothetical protein OEA41_008474 [Lepraria neglecta]|uniref:Uncharacterized protein n=1 Tax=Lepraria neglecta TaxID=209136 RepID=A0AAE0DNV6_9LECA|nr:hypothetical protein OEA41_008474 [Lepraria neglecta]
MGDEPEPDDDSWIKYINEDCTADDGCEPFYPTTSFFYNETKPSIFKTISVQNEVNTNDLSASLQIFNPDPSLLDLVVQGLPRPNLLGCPRYYWEILVIKGIFTVLTGEVFTWMLEYGSEQAYRLHHHLILRHLAVDHDLLQWRPSTAETRNLTWYVSFLAEAQTRQKSSKHVGRRGENNSNKAHTQYLAHIYADRTPKDYKRAKEDPKKDLRYGRRWSILKESFVTDEEDVVLGLGLDFLLLCGPSMAKRMSGARLYEG